MGRIWLFSLLTAFAASTFGLTAAQRGTPGEGSQSLLGTWAVVSAEHQMEPYPNVEGATVIFTDKAFRIERTEERAPWFGELTVDYRKGQIDMLHQYKGFLLPTFGTVWEGIFRFEGDTLVIVHAEGHDARPTEFLTGYDLTMMKLKRK